MKNLIIIVSSMILTALNIAAFGLLIGLFATIGAVGLLVSGFLYFQMEKSKIIRELNQGTQPFFENEAEWKAYYHRDATPLSEESQLKVSLVDQITQLAVI
ncbi:MAG: hypothetical protein LBS33_04150 [Streptococcaceae bacterium]|jgi:hypothetical protein|nr:hypothetical protein [Streptococcaceae bacterium]